MVKIVRSNFCSMVKRRLLKAFKCINLIIFMSQLQVHGEHKTQWITISLDEYESMKSTIEILSSPKAMEKIRRGEQERLAKKGQKLEAVKKELSI